MNDEDIFEYHIVGTSSTHPFSRWGMQSNSTVISTHFHAHVTFWSPVRTLNEAGSTFGVLYVSRPRIQFGGRLLQFLVTCSPAAMLSCYDQILSCSELGSILSFLVRPFIFCLGLLCRTFSNTAGIAHSAESYDRMNGWVSSPTTGTSSYAQ